MFSFMEEIEVPLEKVQEDLHHEAHHSNGSSTDWFSKGALLSALLAVLAAVAALQSGHHANEAMLEQIKSSDRWSFFQAKGIKASVLDTKLLVLSSLKSHEDTSEIKAKIAEYKKEQSEIQAEAKELEESSHKHLSKHETFATSVTFFQIAIALTAIAVLVKRKNFLWLSAGFGFCGLFYLLSAFFLH
jgi:hypothetical protein